MLKLVRGFAVLVLITTFAACEGKEGPMGPSGPEGPEGEAGPGTRITFSGQFNSSGGASIALPAEAGNMANPPAIACYMSDTTAGPWLTVATDTYSTIGCALGESSGRLSVLFIGRAYWHYRIAVVH